MIEMAKLCSREGECQRVTVETVALRLSGDARQWTPNDEKIDARLLHIMVRALRRTRFFHLC